MVSGAVLADLVDWWDRRDCEVRMDARGSSKVTGSEVTGLFCYGNLMEA